MAQDPIKDGEISGDDKDEEEIDGDPMWYWRC